MRTVHWSTLRIGADADAIVTRVMRAGQMSRGDAVRVIVLANAAAVANVLSFFAQLEDAGKSGADCLRELERGITRKAVKP
jgi:hypothetical protein